MNLIGKVLWWDNRDKNGIIVDPAGNEYYFDISVIQGRKTLGLKPGTFVQFQINKEITNTRCAKSVFNPPAKSKQRLEREFERNLQLSFAI